MWLLENIGTIAILVILCTVLGLIVHYLKKNKAAGKSSCGASCAHCAMQGKCHGQGK